MNKNLYLNGSKTTESGALPGLMLDLRLFKIIFWVYFPISNPIGPYHNLFLNPAGQS